MQGLPRLGAHMSIAGGLERAFQRGSRLGCETIQIFTKSNSQWQAKPLDAAAIERFMAAQQETGIEPVLAHDSYLINLASPDEALLARSQEAFVEEMQRAEQIGIPYLVMHPGAHRGSGEAAGLDRVARSLDLAHRRTPGFALMVLLETTAGQGTSLGSNFEQLGRIIDSVDEADRLGICLDTCHLFAAGYDLASDEGHERMWQEIELNVDLDRVRAVHVNDSKRELGSRVDRHEHIGRGAMGLEAFRRLLGDRRLAGLPMILETPKGTDCDGDRHNLEVLRGLRDAEASSELTSTC